VKGVSQERKRKADAKPPLTRQELQPQHFGDSPQKRKNHFHAIHLKKKPRASRGKEKETNPHDASGKKARTSEKGFSPRGVAPLEKTTEANHDASKINSVSLNDGESDRFR